MVESVVVENDGAYTEAEGLGADRDPAALTKQEIRSIIKEAGIVGLGGAGFPTHVKQSAIFVLNIRKTCEDGRQNA